MKRRHLRLIGKDDPIDTDLCPARLVASKQRYHHIGFVISMIFMGAAPMFGIYGYKWLACLCLVIAWGSFITRQIKG